MFELFVSGYTIVHLNMSRPLWEMGTGRKETKQNNKRNKRTKQTKNNKQESKQTTQQSKNKDRLNWQTNINSKKTKHFLFLKTTRPTDKHDTKQPKTKKTYVAPPGSSGVCAAHCPCAPHPPGHSGSSKRYVWSKEERLSLRWWSVS